MKRLLLAGIAQGLLIASFCRGQEVPASPSPTPAGGQPSTARAKKSPTGSLTGTVYCADTNLPARRAQIYLLEYSQNSFSQRSATTTDLEGRFALNAVREGDYYVVAVLRGYVDPLSSLTQSHLDAMSDQERKRMLGAIATVTISANQPAQVSVRLERGIGIEGTVQYDDGSPAIGLQINLKLKTSASGKSTVAEIMGERSSDALLNATDDRGHFRILGVPPGEYLVSVSVPTIAADQAAGNPFLAMIGDSISLMDVYVGGGLRASKAQTIKVDQGGSSSDADITIPLSKLHTLRGQVLLKSTGQPPPTATVELLYADTGEPARVGVAPEGIFEIHYVPEGSFILRASASRTALPEASLADEEDDSERTVSTTVSRTAFSIDLDPGGTQGGAKPSADIASPAEIPVAVTGDMDRITITVPDPPAAPDADGQPDTQGAAPAEEPPNPQ